MTKRYEIETELAPSVDPVWAEAFIIGLRVAGVAGPDIGAALAEVNDHCAQSGQSAQEAFGAPKQYADSLELSPGPEQGPKAIVREVLTTIVQLAGMMLVLAAVGSLKERSAYLEISWGMVGTAVIIAGFVALIAFKPETFIDKVAFGAKWRALALVAALAVVSFVAVGASVILFQQTAVTLKQNFVIFIGGLTLLAAAVWDWRSDDLKNQDLIVDPVTSQVAGNVKPQVTRVVLTLVIPVCTLAGSVLIWTL